ncbi:hypothetical protein [Clostridium saccharoperbutylacetonicum]|uniref:hypothetical protein n=1 Tax=Clostridium saccharoperbutylacetonicum TaxID=36745 RepID=UPI001570F4E9|nr:hypothetical protein [Clostridium saccharoperbutylacetonicum]NSB34790.1 hypothetical protein [Clostridium saccharoperbutylacetonicum]
MVNEIEHKDINGVIKTLKDLKSCGDLQQKEVKYISNIIDRINLDIQSKELWNLKIKRFKVLRKS